MLLIYTNLLHWRVAAVGIFLAYLLAFAVFHIFGGHFFILSEVNIIAIAGSVLVGLASSYTFGFADSKNFEQNARLLRIVSNRVQVALGVQLALSEALRHEANVSEEADLQRRLQEVAERLDVRANLTRAELQEMENEVSQTEFWGGTQLLEVSSLLRSVIIELERTYDYSAPQLKNQLRTHGDSKLVLQGEWGETVQMLASLFAMMLRPNVPALAGQQDLYLDVHWQALPGQVQVEMQRIGGRGTQYTLARGSAGRLKERSLHALAEQLLPAYSVYVLKRMGAELRLGHLEQGTPSWLLITWPAPELIQNRLTGNRRLSLMQMYENHLV